MKTLYSLILLVNFLNAGVASAGTIHIACDDPKGKPTAALSALQKSSPDGVPVYAEMVTGEGWDASDVSSWSLYFEGVLVGEDSTKGQPSVKDGVYTLSAGRKGQLILDDLKCGDLKTSSAQATQRLYVGGFAGIKTNQLTCKCVEK